MQDFHDLSGPPDKDIYVAVGRVKTCHSHLPTKTVDTHTHIARMLSHYDPVVFIKIEHSVFDCKVRNRNRPVKVGSFRTDTHNPTGMTCVSSQSVVKASEGVAGIERYSLLFSRRDMSRPAFPLLIARMLMAGLCGWVMTLTGDVVTFWMLAGAAVMILLGLVTRVAVVVSVVTSVYILFGAVDTTLMPHVMTAIAVAVPLAGFLFVTGAGRWSLDRLFLKKSS